jgi:2-oxoglutarate dehydrogenase complex dehydrogenase (E1) component-like enzyme
MKEMEKAYSLQDLKREDIRSLISYVDMVNRLLKITVPIVGITYCRNTLNTLASEYEILKGAEITEKEELNFSNILENLKKVDEHTGLAMVLGAFNQFILRMIEAYNSMSSSELGLIALITAATGSTNEKLKEIEKAKKKLEEWSKTLEKKVKERTAELKKVNEELRDKLEQLEKLYRTTVGRELRHIELKTEVNYLLEKMGKKPLYPMVYVDEKVKERIDKILEE